MFSNANTKIENVRNKMKKFNISQKEMNSNFLGFNNKSAN